MSPRIAADDDEHLYKALARELGGLIDNGTLRVGDRLPSTRCISSRYGVSMATAVQAFRELEKRRCIEARPRAGYFVTPITRTPQPDVSKPAAVARHVVMPTLLEEYFQALREPNTISLGAVHPPPSWFPIKRLTTLLATTNRALPELTSTSQRAVGAIGLRQVLARRAFEFGCRLSPDEIVITNGCVEALNLCLRAVANVGDTIALESPTYFMLLYILQGLGLKALELPTHPKTGISLQALEAATARRGAVKAVLLMPNYANPLGSLMPDESKAKLVELCERRGVPIIEDDVYGDTYYSGTRPFPAKAWDRSGHVLYCSSVTKTLAPGLRLGWVASGQHIEKITTLKATASGFTPYAPQLAVAMYLERDGYDRHLRRLRATVAESADRIGEQVRNTFPSQCRMTQPGGGYALWVELPRGVDAIEVFRRARAKGIVVTPGPLFTSANRFRNFIRVSVAQNASPQAVREAVRTVGQVVSAMSGR